MSGGVFRFVRRAKSLHYWYLEYAFRAFSVVLNFFYYGLRIARVLLTKCTLAYSLFSELRYSPQHSFVRSKLYSQRRRRELPKMLAHRILFPASENVRLDRVLREVARREGWEKVYLIPIPCSRSRSDIVYPLRFNVPFVSNSLCFASSALSIAIMNDSAPIPPDTNHAPNFLITTGVLLALGVGLCVARIFSRFRPALRLLLDDYLIAGAAVSSP